MRNKINIEDILRYSSEDDFRYWINENPENVKNKYNGGRTVLHYASLLGKKNFVRILIKVPNIDLNSKSDSGWTPLHSAALWGEKEIINILLSSGVDVSIKDKFGRTAADVAFENGDVCKDLFKSRSDKQNSIK